MPIFDVIETEYCKVLRTGPWNAPSRSFFIAYFAENHFRHVLGLPVIDEFATFSSPVFFAPIPILGKIYNAGITLGHKRDPDMGIDLGWPPLCVGYEAPAPELPQGWESDLLAKIQSTWSVTATDERGSAGAEEYEVQWITIGETEVFATTAPLLPKQLRRIAETGTAKFRIAFATGNSLSRMKNAAPMNITLVSEGVFNQLLTTFTQS